MTLASERVALLQSIADAANRNDLMYFTRAAVIDLLEQGLVEQNSSILNPLNTEEMAVRPSAAGFTYLQNVVAAASTFPAPVAAAPVAAPVARDAIPLAASVVYGQGAVPPAHIKRKPPVPGSKRGYGFDSLTEIGHYFFVPATEKRPNPKRSLGGTISGANKARADQTPRPYFKAYAVKAGDICGQFVAPSDGALVLRVEPPVEKPKAVETAPEAQAS